MLNPDLANDLETLLRKLPAARVAVFGDFCLDAYWRLDTGQAELSLETGLPVRRVRRQSYSLGGAGNVVANLLALGVTNVKPVGLVGTDLFGLQMLAELDRRGVDRWRLRQSDRWQTLVYAKPMRGDVEESRFDFGAFNELSAGDFERLCSDLSAAAKEADVVILNQQVSAGLSRPNVIAAINQIVADHPRTRFIADARHHAEHYRGVMFKLNVAEARRIAGEARSAADLAMKLWQRAGQPVFLTRGEHGMAVADGSTVQDVPGVHIVDRTDPVGAGDTVVAVLAGCLAAGASAETAARIANLAASVTVRKLGTTGTASPDEIRAAAIDTDYVYAPELAGDCRGARFVEETEIEIVAPLPADLKIRHAIFDHDGTLSVLRQGWEAIMAPMMVRAILGDRFAAVDPATLAAVEAEVKTFVDRTTGIQTLVQMQGLVKLVRQFGYVPAEKILDERGYKKIYNEQLLEMIRDRVRKLRSGELHSLDFQIKNAGELLRALHARGVKLYLASGTDQADVIAEAQAMGYADLFESRIFGSVGDVKIEAKKMVLDRIIRENRLAGHEFVTFGDGPVEVRETRKRGGVCVGVASDEIRRFGLNPSKRTRLIRAGANLIVPDFSQLPQLLKVLQLT